MAKPLIGITTGTRVDPETGNQYNAAYVPIIRAVERAGGLPLLIPCQVDAATLRALYDTVDAVLLPGGGDIDAVYYNEALHPKAIMLDAPRDSAEIAITRWAVAEDRPLFGICRGHQVLNVALGGTMIQDIPSQLQTDLTHDQQAAKMARNVRVHTVAVDANSRLAQILGTTAVQVNSLHHQAVRDPAPGLTVTAISQDEVIEATEHPDKRFVLSVQWHPEDLAPEHDEMHALFTAFVQAAAASRA